MGLCTWDRRGCRAGGSCACVPQALQRWSVAPPPREYFDVEVEVHLLADERLDLGARRLPQRLDGAPAFADDDALLAVALYEQGGANIHRARGLAEFFDRARDAVRKFLVRSEEHTSELQSRLH